MNHEHENITEQRYVRALEDTERRHTARRGFRSMLRLAKAGYDPAQNELGNLYSCGGGVRRSLGKALYWYHRAYAGGNLSAANNLGNTLQRRGRRISAIVWFERAIELGDRRAHLDIAECVLADRGESEARAYLSAQAQHLADVDLDDLPHISARLRHIAESILGA
jgi:TPR repeat protein